MLEEQRYRGHRSRTASDSTTSSSTSSQASCDDSEWLPWPPSSPDSRSAASWLSAAHVQPPTIISKHCHTSARNHPRYYVVLGDSPLPYSAGVGWRFTFRIKEDVANWVGNLGIGVTLTKPSKLATIPDRAWRLPGSWVAGYWGRMYTNGQQHLVGWKPQNLRVNDEVGFCISTLGVCTILVNGEERMRFADPPVSVPGAARSSPLRMLSKGAKSPSLVDTSVDSSEVELYSVMELQAPASCIEFSPLPDASSRPLQRGSEDHHPGIHMARSVPKLMLPEWPSLP